MDQSASLLSLSVWVLCQCVSLSPITKFSHYKTVNIHGTSMCALKFNLQVDYYLDLSNNACKNADVNIFTDKKCQLFMLNTIYSKAA